MNPVRRIVNSPRIHHPETGLDLCYVTPNLIATSGPSRTYPKRAYRTPLEKLVRFLDSEHGENWAIWEFRAEGTGYPDEAVYGRIRHYPWPDHHPPPFRLVPMIVASMRQWLVGGSPDAHTPVAPVDPSGENRRIVVVHCKAGKGRSGTAAASYLIAECGWSAHAALARFTEARMRRGFGEGVSIPSQRRTVGYVDRWVNAWKGGGSGDDQAQGQDTRKGRRKRHYVDRPVEIVEVHCWGLRNGVKLEIAGFGDEGKRIKSVHVFSKAERLIVDGGPPGGGGIFDMAFDMAGFGDGLAAEETAEKTAGLNGNDVGSGDPGALPRPIGKSQTEPRHRATLIGQPDVDRAGTSASEPAPTKPADSQSPSTSATSDFVEPGGMAVIFRPHTPIRVENSDVLVRMERRSRTPASIGLAMVTASAHAWFNVFFEGMGPERMARGLQVERSGVFEIGWDALDGIKGSRRKGSRALDRLAVVWKVAGEGEGEGEGTAGAGEVPQMRAADWRVGEEGGRGEEEEAELGVRRASDDEQEENGSRAASAPAPAGDHPGTKGNGLRGGREEA